MGHGRGPEHGMRSSSGDDETEYTGVGKRHVGAGCRSLALASRFGHLTTVFAGGLQKHVGSYVFPS